jgi:hypothetical protein
MTLEEWMRFLGDRPPRLPNRTVVYVASDHFEATASGRITKGQYDAGWLYRIDVLRGDRLDAHRNEQGELWVNDFEVTPLAEMELVDPRGACPGCGERIIDNLVWQDDGETVRCATCGRKYKPGR